MKKRVLGVGALAVTICVMYMKRAERKIDRKEAERKVYVDATFVRNMKRLSLILFPKGLCSREGSMVIGLAIVLIARTWLDIWFSGFNGSAVRAIVTKNKLGFVQLMAEFGLMMWPLSIVNNMLKLCISSISLMFRTRLTHYAHKLYLKNLAFYKITSTQLLTVPDQLLTQDICTFADSLAHLYSNIAKPVVDICLFAYKLGESLGFTGPVYMISYFFSSGFLLRKISPAFGKYAANEQKVEGNYRFTHSRIITHNEEIAFYNGGDHERKLLDDSFQQVKTHFVNLMRLKFANGVIDSVFVKYVATLLAYTLLAKPAMSSDKNDEVVETYQRNSGYLVNLSQAIGRILLAGRDLTRFAGYSSRVAELFDVLEKVNSQQDKNFVFEYKDNIIEFQNVPIVTPTGDMLVNSLSFKVEKGMNCLITGPNGCGKSSLFRILGELWPVQSGKIIKPKPEKLFYVPQKPYLALGTLRDQVIYPHSKFIAQERGFNDEKITALLKTVKLRYLLERDGLDCVQDWASALSGGEKQRIAMARLFYHQPQFAILDECTSAVSVDVEGLMYEHARSCGITLFTVSHRTSLVKYHEYLLQFDGEGSYKFKRMEADYSPFSFKN